MGINTAKSLNSVSHSKMTAVILYSNNYSLEEQKITNIVNSTSLFIGKQPNSRNKKTLIQVVIMELNKVILNFLFIVLYWCEWKTIIISFTFKGRLKTFYLNIHNPSFHGHFSIASATCR